jgi:hypothetical protein
LLRSLRLRLCLLRALLRLVLVSVGHLGLRCWRGSSVLLRGLRGRILLGAGCYGHASQGSYRENS